MFRLNWKWKTLATLVVAGGMAGPPAMTLHAQNPDGTLPIEPITEAQPLPQYPGFDGQAAPAPNAIGGNYQQFAPGYGGAYPGMAQKPTGYGYGQSRQPRVPSDYNWMRPVRRPIWRVPVVYQQYWPTHYYTGGPVRSSPAAAPLPVVYQPTDTTQLGVYYQQVPMWQPNPGMLPPAPWPWDWHHYMPAQAYYNRGDWRDEAYVRARYGQYDALRSGYGGYAPGMVAPVQGGMVAPFPAEFSNPEGATTDEAPATE